MCTVGKDDFGQQLLTVAPISKRDLSEKPGVSSDIILGVLKRNVS